MPIPAAQYLRMSTERQQYSFENQATAIKRYADEHGFVIVQSYSDASRSGLLIRNRPGLRSLIKDVMSHDVPFKAILVLDVSRWGRFQDIDESAHYEFLCKQAGTPVHYCCEGFSSESTLANMIIKTLKRSMAAEYSRELSAKVAAGHRRIAALGFRNGGSAGYGLRRLLVSNNGTSKQILCAGERKGLTTDRVILVPGPANEVQCVRDIYRMFIEERLSTDQIAEELNRRKISYLNGARWHQIAVWRVLTHPKYCGSHVLGRRSQILKGPSIAMPKGTWCVVPNAFTPIVSGEIFEEAQRIIHRRTYFKDNKAVLASLCELWAKEGKLSQKLIMSSKEVPSTQTFWRRFGGLRKAYQLIGYTGVQSSPKFTLTRQNLAAQKLSIIRQIVAAFPAEVTIERKNWRERLRLRLRDKSLMTVYLCRVTKRLDGSLRWCLDTERKECCRLSLVIRLNEDGRSVFDFHVLPCVRKATRCTLRLDDTRLLGGVRFSEIGEFVDATRNLARRLSS